MTRTFFLTVVAISILAAPCAASQPQAPTNGEAIPSDYLIGPEDVLGIVFWRETEISGDVTVRPDGQITIPVIGDMQAAGFRPTELQSAITAAAEKYLADPNVAVVVRTINSRKIYVTGRVTTPGAHDLRGPLTVLQALALAGGLNEFADAKKISILRVKNGTTQTFKFNYRDVLRGRGLEQNILLLPGDTIVVP